MTNQNMPADKAREVRDLHRDAASSASPEDVEVVREWMDGVLEGTAVAIVPIEETIARVLRDHLPPTPTLPTLAGMAPSKRAACQWMQADVANHSVRYVIAEPDDGDGEVALIAADGRIEWIFPEYVTPRPDLPRLEWPDADQGGEEVTKVDYVSVAGGRTAYGPWTVARLRKKADPAPALPDGWRLADHPRHGRVIVTTTPDEEGEVYIVKPDEELPRGYDWHLCDPYWLTYLDTDQEGDK